MSHLCQLIPSQIPLTSSLSWNTPTPSDFKSKEEKTQRRIQIHDDKGNDPDGLDDPPEDSSEDEDDEGTYDENGRPKLISIANPRFQRKQHSSTNKHADEKQTSSVKKNSKPSPKHKKRKKTRSGAKGSLQQEKISVYFKTMKEQELEKQRVTMERCNNRAAKTSSSYWLHFQQNVLDSKDYIAGKKSAKEERKQKRQTEETLKKQLSEAKRLGAKRRWDEHVKDFVPKRGLKPSTIEKAVWNHRVTGLNKAFPPSQPGTIYGEMNDEEKEIIKEYEATLLEKELNKWNHQNHCINQVTQLKYDKESKMWWAKLPGEDDPKNEYVDKGYPRWWMEENFHSDFIEMTIMKEVWLPIPVGDSSECTAPKHLLTDVKIQFPQKNKKTCLFSGLASALSYCKHKKEATSLIRRATKVENLDLNSQILEVKRFMASYLHSIGQSKNFNVRTSNHKKNELSLEQLCEDKTLFVTVVVPQMKNGNQNHAFCVVDDLIFDSTQSHAMKLTNKSVEWICKLNDGFERILIRRKRVGRFSIGDCADLTQ